MTKPDKAKDLYLLSEFPPLGGAGGCPAMVVRSCDLCIDEIIL